MQKNAKQAERTHRPMLLSIAIVMTLMVAALVALAGSDYAETLLSNRTQAGDVTATRSALAAPKEKKTVIKRASRRFAAEESVVASGAATGEAASGEATPKSEASPAQEPVIEAPVHNDASLRTLTQTIESSEGKTQYLVSVTYGEDAGVPYNTELKVTKKSVSDERKEALRQALGLTDDRVSLFDTLLDIRLVADGTDVELMEPVEVEIASTVIDPCDSYAIEIARLDGSDALPLPVDNLTGTDVNGQLVEVPAYTRLRVQTTSVGEFALSKVLEKKDVWSVEGETVTIWGPRSTTTELSETLSNEPFADGLTMLRRIGVHVDPANEWASNLWISAELGEGSEQGHAGVRCFVMEKGELGTELFGTSGKTYPTAMPVCEEYAFLWDDGSYDSTTEAEPATYERELVATGGSYNVAVAYDDSAGLPENVRLGVSEIERGTAAYFDYMAQCMGALDVKSEDVGFAKVLDIELTDPVSGMKYQPAGNVTVRVELPEADVAQLDHVAVVHFGDKPEVVAATLEGDSIVFETSGFSPYMLLGLAEPNAADDEPAEEEQTPEVVAPAAKEGLVYTGEAQELVSGGGATGGTMWYALGEASADVPAFDAEEPTGWSTSVPTAIDAGTYYVWYRVVGDEGYADVDPACVTAMVVPAEVVVSVVDAEKTYGDPDPSFAIQVTGLKESDTADDWSCSFTRAAGEAVGEYAITATFDNAVQGNYKIARVDEGTLTVTKATVTVTPNDASKPYGTADPVLTATVAGLKNGDEESVIEYVLEREPGEDVGEYDILADMAPKASEPQNYEVKFAVGTFVITKAKATVTANDATKTYGEEDPDYTATVTGLLQGDDESSISYSFSRAVGENVGTYAITPTGDAEQGNYDVEYVDATLTITRATATVTAEAQAKVYGEEDSQLTAEVTGLQNGDEERVIAYTVTRAAGEDVGAYAITPAGEAVQGNYDVVYKPSTMTIARAPVVVTANANEKVYGSEDPSLTAEVEGLLNGESEDLITYELVRAEGEDVGEYTITASGAAEQGNYAVSFVAGTFTIVPRAITVAVTGHTATNVYDGQPHSVSGYDLEILDNEEQPVMDEGYAYKEEYIRFDELAKAETNPLTNVGEEFMGLSVEQFSNGNDNYAVTFNVADGHQIVAHRDVTIAITGSHDTVNYDGQSHGVDGYAKATDDTLYDLTNVSYNGDATVARVNSGTSYMGLDANGFVNNDTNFDATFEVSDGYIAINTIQITVLVVGNTNEAPYDGNEHVASGYTASSESNLFDPDRLIFTGVAEASRTEITVEDGVEMQTSYMGLVAEDFEYNDENVSAEIVVTDGYQTINKIDAAVTIVGNYDVSDYDGTAHTITGYTATADKVLYDVDDSIVFEGQATATQANVGTAHMGLDAAQFSNSNPNFGTVTFAIESDGYQTVRPITATITIVGNHGSFAYDGQDHEVSGYTATSNTELYDITSDFTFIGTASANRVDAGQASMNLSVSQFQNTNENFSNVDFEITDGYVEVTPIAASVTIVGHAATFTYDGSEHMAEGYDASFSTNLYDESCFEQVAANADRASRVEAGTNGMNLGPDSFRNISPNFEDVTFEVTDGSITIDPAIVVSKYLHNVAALEEETFVFSLILTDDENNPIAQHVLMDASASGQEQIATDDEGRASFGISVKGMDTANVTLDIPYGASLRIEEDKTDDPNNYTTTVNDVPSAEYEQEYVTDSLVTVAYVNSIGNVCRIGEEEFQSISSALAWARENGEHEVAIEMMVDYTMPASDVVEIPADYIVILSTASDYAGDGAATITRALGFTGPMFTNRGTLNIADAYPGTKIVLDGNGGIVTAEDAVIANSGTVSVCSGGVIRNARNSANGGAIYSTGPVAVQGGSLVGNSAANGGAIYSTGPVTLSAATVTGNSATANGGAIYTTEGNVTITGANALSSVVSENTAAQDGGAVYSESGAVDVNGTMRNNTATAGNGGAIFARSGAVSVTGGTLAGNRAVAGNGGAIYAVSGGAGVTGGTIGGESVADANTAVKGAALYVENGNGSFTGGAVTGNVATGSGGAINVGSIGARLSFSASPYVQGNTHTDGSTRNVYLDQDTDLIINALGLNADAEVGVYVPNDDGLYEKRGVSGVRFGGYTNNANLNAFKNDRTPGMTVSEDNYKMQWGKAMRVELRELNPFSATSLPPVAQGSLKKTGEYFPTANENYVSDIAAELLSTMRVISTGYTFACAFVKGATQYGECLTRVDWNNATGDWGFVDRAGQFVTYDTTPATLVLYYSKPTYLNVANNTVYPLNLSHLAVNGIDVLSNAYGFVVARKGTTVEHFVPIEPSDLQLAVGESVKLMFPGVRKQALTLGGTFTDKTDEEPIPYTYTEAKGTTYTSGTTNEGSIAASDATSGFTIPSLHLFDNNNTVDVEFGTATKICKIVELNTDGTVKEEHLYSSIQAAVEDGDANYDAYKISVTEAGTTYDTVKVEMIQDYLMPSTDAPDVPTGRNFTFTTAVNGTTQGPTHYAGTGNRAVISQDQGNINSFFKVSVGGDGTAITIENINFEGKQLDAASTNGGVISTKDSSVTIRHASFSDFTAGNGGAVYAQFGAADKSTYSNGNNWVNISDTMFTNCLSKAGVDKFGGGGIWTNAKDLVMSDCDFTYCNATQQGGAVYHRIDGDYSYTPTSTTRVTNCKFLHCYGGAAGGLEINAIDVEIDGCTFDDCQAVTRNGGGFNAYLRAANTPNTSLRISNTTFNNCFANQDGGVFRTMMNTYVTNCTFTDNTANGLGGGIAQNNGNELLLNGCTVTGNKSSKQGGGIYTNGNLTLENHCVITGNSLTTNMVADSAGVYLDNNKTLTLGVQDAASDFLDTCDISGNVTADGSASNLRLPENNGVNKNAVIVRCNFTTGENEDKQIHVLNANVSGTQFGRTSGVTKPNGFKEGEHIFVADNNDLYGIYDRTTGNKVLWNSLPVCKITDAAGNLLYFDQEGRDPAIFSRLDNGSDSADADGAFSYLKNSKANIALYVRDGNETKRYEGGIFYVKMLVDDYQLTKYISSNANNASWQTIVFTTETAKDGLYPFRGNGDITTIYRTTSAGNNKAMLYVKSNVQLENITLDGMSDSITATSNTGSIVSIVSNGKLTLGNGATLQNSKTNQQRGTAIYAEANGVCEIEDGALIQNCINTQSDGQGGAYFQKGSATLRMTGGTITGCTSKAGGGVFINNGNFYMSGGSIEHCTATNQGGAVAFGNWNDPAPTVYMSGGSMTNNHAKNSGGAMAFVGTYTKVYFSGNPVVYDNTIGDNTQCNVQLNQNSLDIINASGLGESANIGVYTTGSYYTNYGVQGKDFGTWSSNAHLEMFVNDRDTDLRGAESTKTPGKIWWQKMQSLTVTKTVSSELPADARSKEFSFTVRLGQQGINQTFGDMEFKDSVATFTLKHGQTKKAVYIPTANVAGGFTVTEEVDDDFDTAVNGVAGRNYYSSSLYGMDDIEADTTNSLTLVHVANFTNTRKTGDLTVSKNVVSDQTADDDLAFSFRVVLNSNAIRGTYGGMTFSNGAASFTLKNGESKIATGLPAGISYTVTETENSSFSTATTVNGEAVRPAGMSLQAGDNNKVAFTNTRKVGGLRIAKVVSSDATADKSREFPVVVSLQQNNQPVSGSFQAKDGDGNSIDGGVEFVGGEHTFMLRHGESVTIEKLPQGTTYEVRESVGGFTPRFVYTDANGRTDNSRTIGTDITTCTVTNTRQTGRLQLTKSLVSDRSADASSAQFTFVVRLGTTVEGVFTPDAGINKTYSSVVFSGGVGTVTVTGASSKTITGLPQGIAYEVTEQQKDKFALTAHAGDVGTIGSATSVVSFTNTRAVGDLKINKTVVSDAAADFDRSFTFTVRLGDSRINKTYGLLDTNGNAVAGGITFSGGVATVFAKAGESLTIKGLPTDVTYTVTETVVSGFTTTSSNATGTIATNTTVTDDVTHATHEVPGNVVTFTNTRNVGNLTVKKVVVSDLMNGPTNDKAKDFAFTVRLGTYVNGSFVVDESIGAVTEDAPDGRTYGGMTFKNGVATFSLKHGESLSATGLPGDVRYVVTEQSDPDFTTTFTGASGSISPTREAVATFANTRKTGRLVLVKNVVSDVSSDRSQYYLFTIKLGKTEDKDGGQGFVPDPTLNKRYGSVTFQNGVGTTSLRPSTGTASVTLSGLPQGIEYEVSEGPAGYMTTTSTGAAGTVSASAENRAVFTNARDKGDLTVTKDVVSDLSTDKDVSFTFAVKVGNITQTYDVVNGDGESVGSMAFANGTGSLTLKGGESKTIKGLPAGLSYTVTETANGNFTTDKAGDKGIIVTGAAAQATFTNTRKTGDMRITKRVVSDLAGDNDREFRFSVTLTDTTIGQTTDEDKDGKQYGDLTFTDGVATFALKKGQSVTVTGLPTTLGYTVKEEAVAGFTTDKTNDSGSIGSERRDVTFTNTRNTGNLTVQKVLVSDLAKDASEGFGFTVTLSDPSIGAVTADAPNGKTFGGMTFKDGVARFTLKGGESKTATKLPAGITYTVEEAANESFVTTKNAETGEIPTNSAVTSVFTNTRATADLLISKAVASDLAADKNVDFSFSVALTGLSDAAKSKSYGGVQFKNGNATIKIRGGQTKRIEGLPTGAGYTVSEVLTTAQKADFTTEPSSRSFAGTIVDETETDEQSGQVTHLPNTAAFVNTRIPGDLVITKTVVSDLVADKDEKFSFTVTLSDTSIGAVTDANPDGRSFTALLESGEGDDKNTAVGTVTFTNGVANVTVKHGERLTIQGLPTDVKATVRESLSQAQKASFSTVPSNLTRGVTVGSASHTAAFTNTRKTGKLTVKKTLVSDLTADKNAEFAFRISLGSVVETPSEVEGEDDAEAFVVDEALDKRFSGVEFVDGVATIRLKGGDSTTIDGLPTDLTYVVEEVLTETQRDAFVTEPKTARVQGSVSGTATAVATVKNTRKTGDLLVSKEVKNDLHSETTKAADRAKKFNFTVRLGTTDDDGTFTLDEGISGSYGEVTFRKGVGTFTLTDGATKRVDGLPRGVSYVVSEAAASGFIPVLDQMGTIGEESDGGELDGAEKTDDAQEAVASFVNVRPACKITGAGGDLLYFKDEDGVVWPAVYTSLEVAFEALESPAFYADATGEAAYADGAYRVEMLVGTYDLASGLAVSEGVDVTLTTAVRDAEDGFSYDGEAGTVCVVKRTENADGDTGENTFTGSMVTVSGTFATTNITLDGGAAFDARTGENVGLTSVADGGIVHVVAGGTLRVTNGSTLQNSVTTRSGGGVYVEKGAALELSGDVSFGGAGATDAAIDTTVGNFSTGAGLADDATNGQLAYPRARQDIYLAGAAAEGEALGSLVLTNNLASTVPAGSIWVWAEGSDNTQPNHYYMLKQFAVLGAGFSGEVTQTTYQAFRNARADADTDCGGDYLTGQAGDDINDTRCVYWTGGYDVDFLKVDGSDQPLAGATFALYTAYKSVTDNTPYEKSGEPVVSTSSNEADAKGVVQFAKVAPKTYYMIETTAPEGFEDNKQTIYRVTVASDGTAKIEQKLLSEEDDAYVETPKVASDGESTYHVMNVPTSKRRVILRKVDEGTGVSLAGAQFRLYRADGTEVINGDYDKDTYYESASSGVYFVDDLPYGTYRIEEVKAPTGYKAQTYTLTVSADEVNVVADWG